MIDNNKIGNYIKELRTNNKLTQEELAEKIHVSRQAVSNWETGKDAPSIDNVNSICLLFNDSMANIYAGEEIKDIKTLNDIIHSLVSMEMKKSKKIMLISSVLIFILIILFLVYYFITYYNNITSYLVNADTSKYDINGIMNKSVDNLYFDLEVDTNPEKICILYKDNELLCKTNSNYIIISESNGYNEIMPLDKKGFNNYISNMYVSIEKDGKVDTFKLNIIEVYKNSNLLKEEYESITKKDDEYKLEIANVPDKIKNEFKYNKEEESFRLIKKENGKNIDMSYFAGVDSFEVIEKEDNIYSKWVFDNNGNFIIMYEMIDLLNNKVLKTFNNVYENDNNKNKKQIYDYFKENYIDKYLN